MIGMPGTVQGVNQEFAELGAASVTAIRRRGLPVARLERVHVNFIYFLRPLQPTQSISLLFHFADGTYAENAIRPLLKSRLAEQRRSTSTIGPWTAIDRRQAIDRTRLRVAVA